ncbi:MAG TPA: iron ABC transporter permease [Candidatus Krumholzibacterium sp.]|nr:iron ABC transporter permease [Candidatus Krumholzibacterium sp.]
MRAKNVSLAAIIVFSILVTASAPFFGIEKIGLRVLTDTGQSVTSDIFWQIRLPRVISAFVAGATLALAGMAFQAYFRNPLATPFTLGVSSGAAFGSALAIRMGLLFSFAGITARSLSAFLWAMVAILIVYGLTRLRKGFSSATMLVAGVAVNFFFSSVILFIQYISDFDNSFRMVRWMMGGFEIIGYDSLTAVLPFSLIGIAILAANMNEMNLLVLGEETASSRGVDIRRARISIFFSASLMTGGVVSAFGPVGFVGMMAPHICRLMVGADHRVLAPASLFFGGAFLVLCDTIARTLIAPAEIPVGVLTALLGGPFFLWLLMKGFSESVSPAKR